MPFPLGVYVSPDNTICTYCKTILAVPLGHCSPGDPLDCSIALSMQAFCTSRQKLTMVLLLRRISMLSSHCHEPCFLPFLVRRANHLICLNFLSAATWPPLRMDCYCLSGNFLQSLDWKSVASRCARLGLEVSKQWSLEHITIAHVVLPATGWQLLTFKLL